MRRPKATAVVLAAAAVLTGGTVLLAGDFHNGASLICSDCHVMHFSQTHGYTPDGTVNPAVPLGAGPNEYLLRDHVNDLCLACHDGSAFVIDVLKGHAGTATRQAGALNRDNLGGYYDTTGHTLDYAGAAPGDTAGNFTGSLECTSCHHPHGYGGPNTPNPYRNLAGAGFFGTSVSYNVNADAANLLTTDVLERSAAFGGLHYDISNVDFNEPNSTASGMANWCAGCHGDFHGTVGGAEVGGSAAGHFERHPSAGIDIGDIGGGHSSLEVYRDGNRFGVGNKTNWVKVMSPTGVWPKNGMAIPATLPTDLTATCITCHKGHGNQNEFGLIYMEETGTVTEQGTDTGGYVDLCAQCHVQAP